MEVGLCAGRGLALRTEGRGEEGSTHEGMILDMDDPKQHRVVHVRDTLTPFAHRSADEGRRMVQVDAVHVGPEDVGEAVVRRRERVEWAQGEVRDVFVDLLRDEGDVEEELQVGRGRGKGWRRLSAFVADNAASASRRTSSFSPSMGDQFFSMFVLPRPPNEVSSGPMRARGSPETHEPSRIKSGAFRAVSTASYV